MVLEVVVVGVAVDTVTLSHHHVSGGEGHAPVSAEQLVIRMCGRYVQVLLVGVYSLLCHLTLPLGTTVLEPDLHLNRR